MQQSLNDGDNDTYVYSYTYYEPDFTMTFNKAKTLSGIGILCNYTSYGYGVKKVAVSTSLDGKTWIKDGYCVPQQLSMMTKPHSQSSSTRQ